MRLTTLISLRALILQSCTAVNAAYPYSALIDLAEENWELVLRTHFVPGQATPEEAERTLDYLSKTITQSDHVATRRAFAPSDISELLPRLRVATLVLFPTSHSSLSPEHAARLAALVPGARLVLIGGSGGHFGDSIQGLATIESFLEELPPEERERSASSAAASPGLSPREREVLSLIAQGRSNQRIADELVVSVRTVERHITNLYAKIGAHGKAEATAYALRHGLV